MDPRERSEQSCNHGCNALQYNRYHHDSWGLCIQMDDQQWCLYPIQQRGNNHNQATITVARKLVAFLLAVDKSGKAFVKKAEQQAA